MVVKEFPGLKFAELERELQALEDAGLVRVVWRGPGDFTASTTPQGERAVVRA